MVFKTWLLAGLRDWVGERVGATFGSSQCLVFPNPLHFTMRAPGVICFIHSRFSKAVPVKINTQRKF